jgi:hypothetical protein
MKRKTKLIGTICFNVDEDQDVKEAVAFVEDAYKDLIAQYGFVRTQAVEVHIGKSRGVSLKYVAFVYLTKKEKAYFREHCNQLEELSFALDRA